MGFGLLVILLYMRILGIETSFDETAAAVVENDSSGKFTLLSNVVASSADLHMQYGGVVPEIAARSHIESILPVIEKALTDAFPSNKLARPGLAKSELWSNIDAIAVTRGPGLSGSLLIGVLTARTLAILHNKPLYAVNHVLAHPYASFITSLGESFAKGLTLSKFSRQLVLPQNQPKFPMLALIVSGGHTQLAFFDDHSKYSVLGRTTDDAVGEAYDKVAKILGLPFPGGPSVEKLAIAGSSEAVKLPTPKTKNVYDFSYSGLKTAVLRSAQAAIGEDYGFPSHMLAERLSKAQKIDIAASFNQKAMEILVKKTIKAYREFAPKSIVVAGGVAASRELRRQLDEKSPLKPIYPDPKLCTDNAAMIAARAAFVIDSSDAFDPFTLEIQPNLEM